MILIYVVHTGYVLFTIVKSYNLLLKKNQRMIISSVNKNNNSDKYKRMQFVFITKLLNTAFNICYNLYYAVNIFRIDI